jgi:hypothetical protein
VATVIINIITDSATPPYKMIELHRQLLFNHLQIFSIRYNLLWQINGAPSIMNLKIKVSLQTTNNNSLFYNNKATYAVVFAHEFNVITAYYIFIK